MGTAAHYRWSTQATSPVNYFTQALEATDMTIPVPDSFARFRAAYPKRKGPQPTAPALAKFQSIIKSGVDPETLIRAAARYAAEQRSLGHIDTPYVAQMSTWLNQSRWQDYAPDPAPLFNGTGIQLTSEWINLDDPRWQGLAERYKNQNGRKPPTTAEKADMGWYFSKEWLTT